MEAAEKAFARARVVDKGRQRLSQLARMHAHMCQGLGQHRRAIDLLTEALNSDLSCDATVECLHLRGKQRKPRDILCTSSMAERLKSSACCCITRTCQSTCIHLTYTCTQPDLMLAGPGACVSQVGFLTWRQDWHGVQTKIMGSRSSRLTPTVPDWNRLCMQAHATMLWGITARQ